jgi:hypothetical protein
MTARFASKCDECGGKIEVDDEIVFVAGAIEHVVCDSSERLVASRPAGEICRSCFLELPTSGVCGNCE